ncbi:hypothetical protein EMPS_05786 [Entomortierella parvispora]|uniref:Uncharacterized protein n=1 Tax=Entomortierella parvispora TaxID=205924 RepID=A0A9P3HBM1_9FUNG|nr:hypothetical protein EMPS_05786 [Entomortierella parvispora]
MDPPQTRQSSGSNSEHNYDKLIASYWRQHRRPATYLDDHDHSCRLAPLQPSSSPPLPPIPSSRKRLQRKWNQILPEDIVGGSSTAPAPLSSVATVNARDDAAVLTGEDDRRNNPLPPLPLKSLVTERSASSFMASALAKLQRKSANSSRSTSTRKNKKRHQQKSQKDSLESSSNPSPSSSSGTDGIKNPISMDSSTSSHSQPDSLKSNATSGSAVGHDSFVGRRAQHGELSAHQSATITLPSNNKEATDETKQIPKRQRPILPKIIIPDGTSINLSTPPTTPTQQNPLGPAIRPSHMTPWPYNFLQINERLRRPTVPRKASSKTNSPVGGSELDQRRSPSERDTLQQEQQTQQDGEDSMETTLRNEVPTQEPSQSLQHEQQGSSGFQSRRYSQEPGETTVGNAGSVVRTYEVRGYLPEFGIMGLPMVYCADSFSSSEKYVWWGYDEHEHGPGGVFSGAFWRRRFSTRPALINTLKHAATTTLGLLIIVAITLTALGKIKHRDQVSDSIPRSLDGTIMEAQVAVVKDMSTLRLSKAVTDSTAATPGEQYMINHLDANPESFGIALPENWPSLCNSCIEITRNQFVYKTTVRILGDLQTCFALAPEDDQKQSTPPPSYPQPPPPPLPPSPSLSPALIMTSASISTLPSTLTLTLRTTATPSTIRKKHKKPHAPKDDQDDRSKKDSHLPKHRPHGPDLQQPTTASVSSSSADPTNQQHPQNNDLLNVNVPHDTEAAMPERIVAPLQRRQAGPSSSSFSSYLPSTTSSSPPISSLPPSPSGIRLMLPLAPSTSDGAPQLPYLIVDPATFDNLTKFDSRMVIENMDYLRVQFRFVVCEQ